MPKKTTSAGERLLFDLIHSLTKSEKRSFKLYVKRGSEASTVKFVQLFDVMEKLPDYDEDAILKKLPGVSKTQFSNLKAHLYSQLLASLRQGALNHDIDIQLREQLDYIRLLYKKGLYAQSLRLLNRAKNVTGQYRKDLFQLSLLDYEKQIRSQQVFDLEERLVDEMDQDTLDAMERFGNVQHFFTLAIKLKARFIEKGMVKNETEMNNLKALFQTKMRPFHDKEEELAFNEKFYYYRACYWYAYLTYDFQSCIRYAEKWVKLFEFTELDSKRRAGFLKGLNRLLQSAFRVDDREVFRQYYQRLIHFEEQEGPTLASNTQLLLAKYKAMQSLNLVFLNASFAENRETVEAALEEVLKNEAFMDKHTLLILYYKAGIFYFALNDYEKALSYLNRLIDDPENLRSDLKGFGRIVRLIIYYEKADEDKMERRIKTTYAFLKRQESLGEFQHTILDFLDNLGNIFPQDIKKGFSSLKEKLEALKADKYKSKALLYFDIISWLDAKIEGISFGEAVKKKVSE